MKVTLGDIQNSKDILGRLANTDMPIKTSFELARLIKKLNEEYVAIEECRTRLIQEHGEEIENANMRVVPGTEGFDSFMKAYSEFMLTEIDIPVSPIEININHTNAQVKPIDIIAIEKFVNFTGIEKEVVDNASAE